ncbi:protein farnesyltransferase subunit beta [Diachasma alloeum]|uniref:protein farnesyltransferase subunit beta n=1 Tax=Diachasma alloeum TaxID=454923 RepID=UPI00073830CE|nr:protein farnesyltransferase subunit beta [Diachasma alloeum]
MWKTEFYDAEEEESVRMYSKLREAAHDTEGVETVTSREQEKVEGDVLKLYNLNREPLLTKSRHIGFLKKSLINISAAYECLDCSRPWLCYWGLHALQILGERLEVDEYQKIVQFLSKCQDPEGGFGGGPGQYPHLASTYAAVSALCIIETREAYEAIDRESLYKFLKSVKYEDGSFSMHRDGEVDIRGVYCAIAVAKLTNVYTPSLFKNTEQWIARCQTWEGGFGGCPGMEAHGGYTYCGLASLVLLGKTHMCHLPSLLRWLVNKQMQLEGGFQGRTNKLVDGCYSFWQGASFPLIHAILSNEANLPNTNYWLFDQAALQEYLLICCQHPYGGLLDKPEKNRDIYHTCYGLSGLSIAQNSPTPLIVGRKHQNSVEIIHPLYNLVLASVANALSHFNKLPLPD